MKEQKTGIKRCRGINCPELQRARNDLQLFKWIILQSPAAVEEIDRVAGKLLESAKRARNKTKEERDGKKD